MQLQVGNFSQRFALDQDESQVLSAALQLKENLSHWNILVVAISSW